MSFDVSKLGEKPLRHVPEIMDAQAPSFSLNLDGSGVNHWSRNLEGLGLDHHNIQVLSTKQRKDLIAEVELSNGWELVSSSGLDSVEGLWEYIVTVSGGGGHLQAARRLAADAGQEILGENGVLKRSKRAVVCRDLMRSLASFGSWVGTRCTDSWDFAKLSGDIDKQEALSKYQPLSDQIFYYSTYTRVFLDLISQPQGLPCSVRVTQPLQLPAILDAVDRANSWYANRCGSIDQVDLYLTDFPKPQCEHFVGALQRLCHYNPDLAKLLQVHSPSPSKKDLAPYLQKTEGNQEEALKLYWKDLTGIENLKVLTEPMPVAECYRDAHDCLASPGQACTMSIQAQIPEEKEFLSQVARPKVDNGTVIEDVFEIDVSEGDKMQLVMLGSQPDEEATEAYAKAALDLAIKLEEKGIKLNHKCYVFVACGRVRFNQHPDGLYHRVLALAKQVPELSSLRIVPFTGQPAQEYFGRCDLSTTSSGGLTTGEVVALKGNPLRTDNKRVLIHSKRPADLENQVYRLLSQSLIDQGIDNLSFGTLTDKQLQKAYVSILQAYRNARGNPLWEGGNAEYLMDEFPNEVFVAGPDCIEAHLRSIFCPELGKDFLPKVDRNRLLSEICAQLLDNGSINNEAGGWNLIGRVVSSVVQTLRYFGSTSVYQTT